MVCEKYRLQAFDTILLPVANPFCLSITISCDDETRYTAELKKEGDDIVPIRQVKPCITASSGPCH
ncbi:MAG: hypothetical protein LBU37_04830 [Tannerellaceae bacterium]|jgi:hypothetical protein|nr:hypothetical protein [Tannerellaceae bacterium]